MTGSTTNESHIIGGRKLSSNQLIALESGGFLVAEMASMAAGLGVVAVADLVIPKPILKFTSKCVAKCVVEPFLEPIEKGMGALCKLKECQVDSSKPREERAEDIAKTMILFGGAYVASLLVKLHTRRGWNNHFGITGDDHIIHPPANASTWQKIKHYGLLKHWTPQEKVIFAVDEGVHIGALYLLNNTLAPFTDKAIQSTTNIIQKTTGCSERKAHEIASMAWVWEAANGLGAVAGIGIIAGNHKFDLSRRLADLVTKPTHADLLKRKLLSEGREVTGMHGL